MQVLILGDDHRQQARLAAAMMKHGFQVFCVESAPAAASYIRNELIDVLVLTETRSGRISQSCACIAQSRNRAVSVIVMSDRTGPAMEELFEEVPQLYGVMGLAMAPAMVAALALASILPQQVEAESRQQPQAQDPAPQVEAHPTPAQTSSMAEADAPAIARDAVLPTPAPVVRPKAPQTPMAVAPLERILIEPMRRAAAPRAQDFAAQMPAPAAQNVTVPLPVGTARGWTGVTLSDSSDIGSDLAALERELELVNRDRPSVLAASIADDMPRWSQPAPKLAMLTDWALATPASTDVTNAAEPLGATALLKARADRRLELGATLQ